MANKATYPYFPDYAVPPGETLLETLESLGISQAELANRTGRPLKTVNEIVKGKAAITPETAIQFERVLGVPASFWNNRERQYREALARLQEGDDLSQDKDWIDQFPVSKMIEFQWVRRYEGKVAQTRELLNFLGVASPQRWESVQAELCASFRRSRAFRANPFAIGAWLRRGELIARSIKCSDYDQAGFQEALTEVRKLTIRPPEEFLPKMRKICASVGVAVVFVPELPGTYLFGATQWLNPRRALLLLSLRYKMDDYLWFTFFHESCHILKHPKKERFIEDRKDDDELEKEANQFSGDILIPPAQYKEFVREANWSKVAIRTFAKRLGISPGIVVGRLQHDDHIPFTHCNDLKLPVGGLLKE